MKAFIQESLGHVTVYPKIPEKLYPSLVNAFSECPNKEAVKESIQSSTSIDDINPLFNIFFTKPPFETVSTVYAPFDLFSFTKKYGPNIDLLEIRYDILDFVYTK